MKKSRWKRGESMNASVGKSELSRKETMVDSLHESDLELEDQNKDVQT